MTDNYSDGTERWFEPSPTSAIRVDTGSCRYDDCENPADYLVKLESPDGTVSAKFRTCQSCSDENRIWAERHLPTEADRHE